MEDAVFDPIGEIGACPTCGTCGSEDVVCDAWAEWDPQNGLWELREHFDLCFCCNCEHSTSFIWKWHGDGYKARIRKLNDALRTGKSKEGTIVITAGVQARGETFFTEATKAVVSFNDFIESNDPHGEHDFGAFEVDSEKLFWKIDYYDRSETMHSPDAANPKVTRRVLTIMLASEY